MSDSHTSSTAASKRRRLSPEGTPSRRHEFSISDVQRNHILNFKELLCHDIKTFYRSPYPPVDLYRVLCPWQEAFPLLGPFQPTEDTYFQVSNFQ